MIDWALLCALLQCKYKSLATVAREIGLDGATLTKLARGEVKSPRFESGVKLLDLAFDVLPEADFQRVKVR